MIFMNYILFFIIFPIINSKAATSNLSEIIEYFLNSHGSDKEVLLNPSEDYFLDRQFLVFENFSIKGFSNNIYLSSDFSLTIINNSKAVVQFINISFILNETIGRSDPYFYFMGIKKLNIQVIN